MSDIVNPFYNIIGNLLGYATYLESKSSSKIILFRCMKRLEDLAEGLQLYSYSNDQVNSLIEEIKDIEFDLETEYDIIVFNSVGDSDIQSFKQFLREKNLNEILMDK